MPEIANATTAPEERDEIKITTEMISAAAEVLWMEPALDIPQGWAEGLAKQMLQRALQGSEAGSE